MERSTRLRTRVFVQTGQDYLGCMAAVHGSCRNRRTIRRGKLQAQVLDLIGNQFMRPALVVEFVAAYSQERLKGAGEAKATIESRQRERAALDRTINNLVDAMSDGRSSPTIMAKLAEDEALRDKAGRSTQPAGYGRARALHPNIAEAYAATVDDLKAALARGDNPDAIETARALIDKVIVHPPEVDGDPPGTELVGKLMALLGPAGVPEAQVSKNRDNPRLFLPCSLVR
jgi:site-specific DNA recombinase